MPPVPFHRQRRPKPSTRNHARRSAGWVRAPAVSVWLASLALTGCGLFGRVEDCNAISEIVRRQMPQVSLRLADARERSSAYLDIAAAYEALAWQLGRLTPRDQALDRTLKSYTQVIERAARQSRAYARELGQPTRPSNKRKKRKERLERIRGQVKSDRGRHVSVFRKLNSICHPR